MNLESLANELLIDLFEYLSTAQLLQAFFGLNSRFDSLLVNYLRIHGLDFRSISRQNFDIIYRHLPAIAHQIPLLYLSENDDTPKQIDQFYSHDLTLCHFIHLQSLSFMRLNSRDTMNRILIDLPCLSNITHLNFEKCCFEYDEANALTFVNTIWSLPKLTHCYMKIQFKPQIFFPIPTVTSLTIEQLSISDIEPQLIYMAHLMECTPNLRQLSIDFHIKFSDECQSSTTKPLITLNILFCSIDYHSLVNFLKIIPYLRRLKIDLPNLFIDGDTWEYIIRIYLPQLESFQFRMSLLNSQNITEEHIDDILNLFRSSFWIDKYQLCVRCDWNPYSNKIFIYSLPYAFDNFYFQSPILSKSTYYYENQQSLYKSVHTLTYKTVLSEWSAPFHIKFNRLRELYVYLPINDCFWSIVPRLDQLTLLHVSSLNDDYDENCQNQLQTLLDRVTHISVLRLRNYSLVIPQTALIPRNNISISQMDLMWYSKWYNYEECVILSRLLSDIGCKVLLIDVTNRSCILELVTTIVNLRALHVRCEDDTLKNATSIVIEDELIEWLRQHLPSSWTILRDHCPICCIRIWIY